MDLSPTQRKALEQIWFLHGNYGNLSKLKDHKFIQGILERGEDCRKFYKPSKEVIEKVDAILGNA